MLHGKPPGFLPRRFVRQLDARFNGTGTPTHHARCRALWLPIEIKGEIVSMEPVVGKTLDHVWMTLMTAIPHLRSGHERGRILVHTQTIGHAALATFSFSVFRCRVPLPSLLRPAAVAATPSLLSMRAHPDVAFRLRGQGHPHRFGMDRRDDGVRELRCTEDHLAGLRNQEGGRAKVSSKSSNHFWPRGGEDDVQRD